MHYKDYIRWCRYNKQPATLSEEKLLNMTTEQIEIHHNIRLNITQIKAAQKKFIKPIQVTIFEEEQ